MMHMVKQLNVEIPETLVKRIKLDAVDLGVSLNEYGRQAFERFLSMKKLQRRVYFADQRQRKIYGRRISTL